MRGMAAVMTLSDTKWVIDNSGNYALEFPDIPMPEDSSP